MHPNVRVSIRDQNVNATCEMIEQQPYMTDLVSAERLGLAADNAPD